MYLKRNTIVVPFRNKKYIFDVLEVKPGKAIHIIDSEVTTEFAAPLNGDIISFSNKTLEPSQATTENSEKQIIGEITGRLEKDNSQIEGIDYQICDNCHQRIPKSSFVTHSLSCSRINWYCNSCGSVIQKSQQQTHIQEKHSKITCECGIEIEKIFLENHKKNDCPKRLVHCDYCSLQIAYIEKYQHQIRCGSQTEKCINCNRYIKKKGKIFIYFDIFRIFF